MTDIGTLGGPQASASAVNASGQIVGFAQTTSDADQGFLYSGGKMTDLGLNVFPNAINDSGVIVGTGGPGGAFVGTPGHLQSLNSLIPAGSGTTVNNRSASMTTGRSSPTAPRARPARPTYC
jgi:probable HAF family extracellular repeat protein